MTEQPIPVLVNTLAGPARGPGPVDVARAFTAEGLAAVVECPDPAALRRRVRELAAHPVVAVAGGDGTMRSAASVLAGTDTVLAPVPTGRLNHFARRVGCGSLAAAARAARAASAGGTADGVSAPDSGSSTSRRVPVGRAGDEIFLNTAVVGAYPSFLRLRERLRPMMGTKTAAAAAGLAVLARWPRFDLTVITPERRLHCRTPMLWIGVGRGTFPDAHEAPHGGTDAVLEAVVVVGGRTAALRVLGSAFAGRTRDARRRGDLPGPMLHESWIRVDADAPLPVSLDGEPHLFEPPLTVRVEPGALRVAAGPSSAAEVR